MRIGQRTQELKTQELTSIRKRDAAFTKRGQRHEVFTWMSTNLEHWWWHNAIISFAPCDYRHKTFKDRHTKCVDSRDMWEMAMWESERRLFRICWKNVITSFGWPIWYFRSIAHLPIVAVIHRNFARNTYWQLRQSVEKILCSTHETVRCPQEEGVGHGKRVKNTGRPW